MPSRFRVWSVGRLLLLVGALGGTFLLFFGVALRVALRAREVQVPALVGKTVNEATQSLARSWPDAEGRSERAARDAKIAANRIMQQDPPAGVAGARAAIDPRLGQRRAAHDDRPELMGQTERTARLPPRAGRRRAGLGLRVPLARLPG